MIVSEFWFRFSLCELWFPNRYGFIKTVIITINQLYYTEQGLLPNFTNENSQLLISPHWQMAMQQFHFILKVEINRNLTTTAHDQILRVFSLKYLNRIEKDNQHCLGG